jgi:hypothetical protein
VRVSARNVITLDFINIALEPGARAGIELTLETAKEPGRPAALAYATAFVEEAKASGLVRRSLDSFGMQSAVVPPAGTMP